MIIEDYVSFEIAKLLKEKGFPQEYDVYHSMVYNEEDYQNVYEVQRMILETRFVKAGTLSSYPIGVPEPKCYCPTLQMAMKWLREVHNIFIAINMIPDTIQKPYFFKPYVDGKIYNFPLNYSVEFYATYEEACESAIKYCLENLI